MKHVQNTQQWRHLPLNPGAADSVEVVAHDGVPHMPQVHPDLRQWQNALFSTQRTWHLQPWPWNGVTEAAASQRRAAGVHRNERLAACSRSSKAQGSEGATLTVIT